jgi:hypothetical protein
MQRARVFVSGTLFVLALGGFGGARALAACDDPAAAEVARAQIASGCPCTGQTNHGQYVSCVARAVRTAVDNGLPVNCKGAVMRCAARSTCGKRTGFSTCCYASAGVCDAGLCQDGVTQCTLATQCPVVNKCRTKSSSDLCVASGGSPGTGSCCDAVCSLPPS